MKLTSLQASKMQFFYVERNVSYHRGYHDNMPPSGLEAGALLGGVGAAQVLLPLHRYIRVMPGYMPLSSRQDAVVKLIVFAPSMQL